MNVAPAKPAKPFRHKFTLAAGCAAFLLVGCDDQSADRQVREDVRKSYQLVAAGTAEARAEAQALLSQALSGNTEASPAVQANAQALLAQIELETARTARRAADEKMMQLSRLGADIAQLAQQISTTNALVAGYRQYDPKEALAAIEKNIADATGGPDKPAWFTHENTQIPTLAVLRQEISRLQGEIASLQEKLDQLGAQRQQVLAEADKASRAAEGRGDEQTLEAFRRTSELRKQAADLAVEIDGTQAAMVPLRNDLAIAQSQQQVIEGLIEHLNKQAEALTQGWQIIQQQMAAQNALSSTILQGTGGGAGAGAGGASVPPGGAISDKATQLNTVLKDLQELRNTALENARNAAEHYGRAVASAEELRATLSERLGDPKFESRPERQSWQTMRDVMHPAAFRLQQASAFRTLAGILTSQASSESMRIELRNLLADILENAGLTMPDQLQAPNLEREREDTLIAANDAYTQADELLVNIIDGQASEDVQNAAYVARMLTLYGWSQLNRLAGDEQAAQEHLELAREVQRVASERGVTMPALPEGLGGIAPATAPAAPAEPAPAETPADQPADAPADPPTDAPADPPADQPAEPPAEPSPGAAD